MKEYRSYYTSKWFAVYFYGRWEF